jgi:thiol-disulfide isomerase/thioredoxin
MFALQQISRLFSAICFGRAIYVAAGLFGLFLLAGCRPAAAPISVSNRPSSINDRPTTNVPNQPSKPLAEMNWTDDTGRVIRLGDLKGKAVILDFWATNCPPCREEIPHLNSLLARYGEANLAIFGLHVGDIEDKANIPAFTAETRLDYPIGYPETALTSFVFATTDAIPQTLVIDRSGQIVKKLTGFNDRIRLDLDSAVEAALIAN